MMTEHLNILGPGFYIDFHFDDFKLTGFSLKFYTKLFDVEFYKNQNALMLVIVTNNARFYCNIEFEKDFVNEFNEKVLHSYINEILKNADEKIIKTFVEDFISFIDRLTDYRFTDILIEAKKMLKEKEIDVTLLH